MLLVCHCSSVRHDCSMNINSVTSFIIRKPGILFQWHIFKVNDFPYLIILGFVFVLVACVSVILMLSSGSLSIIANLPVQKTAGKI